MKHDIDYLRTLLSYDSDTGIFKWLPRVVKNKYDKAFNTRRFGKDAGCVADRDTTQYIVIRVGDELYLAHHLAWAFKNNEWPNEIDHEDGDGLNNKISNLRSVDRQQNMSNRSIPSNNKSGVIGVRLEQGKWRAQIAVKGKKIHIGMFDSFEDAAAARKKEEARLGFHENHGRKRAP